MADLPFIARQKQHAIGKAGRRSEARLVKHTGGRARPASGAMKGAKGDIDFGHVLMECKSTTSGSLGVKLDWLCKIAAEARAEGKTPVLSVSFVEGTGTPRRDGEWVLVPLYKLKEWL